MGISANQARFLSLTARQVDMEQRIQQICQRRLRLSSELENVATAYNNSISNRHLFTTNINKLDRLNFNNIKTYGYSVLDNETGKIVDRAGLINKPGAVDATAIAINSESDFLNLVSQWNTGVGLNGNYVLNCDIDFADNAVFSKAVVNNAFSGTFDGQGHTIKNTSITTDGTQTNIGFFSSIEAAGTVKNLSLDNVNISSTANNQNPMGGYWRCTGTLAGTNKGVVDNVSVQNSSITLGDSYGGTGGLVGELAENGKILYSTAEVDIVSGSNSAGYGGLVGDYSNPTSNMVYQGVVSNSYATGSITVGNNSKTTGGLVGDFGDSNTTNGSGYITNSYSDVDIVTGTNSASIGGLVGDISLAGSSITNSYSLGSINVGSGSSATGGFLGKLTNGTVDNTNFYHNNLSSTAGSATTNQLLATIGWDSDDWDLSGNLPIIKGTNNDADSLEEGLRNGIYSLVKEADEFTQNPLDIGGYEYEISDWRAVPQIYDELNRGDDVAAEDKYDKTVSEINAQDKKLQLEQTSVEVEYKAVSSEKEAVKKILDTNAQSSFKYFS